jgi:hypothetical protein
MVCKGFVKKHAPVIHPVMVEAASLLQKCLTDGGRAFRFSVGFVKRCASIT